MAIINKSKMQLNKAKLDHDCLASERVPLLAAWDIVKGNIAIGATEVTDEEKAELIAWYKAVCDMDSVAIHNPPALIAKHVKNKW